MLHSELNFMDFNCSEHKLRDVNSQKVRPSKSNFEQERSLKRLVFGVTFNRYAFHIKACYNFPVTLTSKKCISKLTLL